MVMPKEPKPVGVLGGMGPAATLDFLQKLIDETPATCDQDHVPVVMNSITRTPDRSAAILHQGASPLPAMLSGAEQLLRAGAGCIVMPCNTAHYWSEPLAAQLPVPLLDIMTACCDEIALRFPRGTRIGLMATEGTLRARLYQDRLEAAGYRVLAPTEREQRERVQAGIEAIKAGQLAMGAALVDAAADQLRSRGCDALLLACSELPVAMAFGSGRHLDISIDATRALARRALGWWQAQTQTASFEASQTHPLRP